MSNADNFKQMEKGFDFVQALAEADRCLLCFDAPCSKGCPAETQPGTFLRKLRLRNVTGAIRTIKENNILGGACGVLCPTPRLCEKECSATGIGRPIEIGKVQRFLIEHSWDMGFKAFDKPEAKGEKIAVVGSGPAGLSCAAELSKQGFRVTVFEARPEPGGVIRYGVPSYRYNRAFLEHELDDVKSLGVEFRCSSPIRGKEGAEKLLQSGFKAVFLAPGLWDAVSLKPGFIERSIQGLYNSVDYLVALREDLESLKEEINGRTVAVIGGGSVAMDCVESTTRLGARDVYLVYRRSYSQMPAEEEERIGCLSRGAHFLLLNQPVDFVTEGGKKIRGLKLARTRLGETDESGRRRPVRIEGSEWVLEADVVIVAIGNKATEESSDLYPNIKVDSKKLILADPETGSTSLKGIFAGGDIVRGPALVVEAVQDGRVAARAIKAYLREGRGGLNTPNKKIDLSIDFCGSKFKNPFLLSSSPVSNSAEMIARAFEAGWSGVVYKTLGADRIPIVHPSPRMNAYHRGSERLVGLQNVEQITDRPLKDNLLDLLYLKKNYPDHIIIASLMGFSNEEWAYLAKKAEDNGADMLELNFSCPHMTVEGSGAKVGQAFTLIQKFTTTVKEAVSIPVIAKMTPNITDMTEPALYAKQGGADAISAINTVSAISEVGLDDWTPRPNIFGVGARSGYSGPAVKPIALRFIADLAKCEELGLPLSGIGGAETWIDALEFLLLGASTIQVTTGIIHYGYRIVEDMIEGLADYMAERGIGRVKDLVGKALPQLQETDHFDLDRQGIAQYNLDICIGCGQCYIVCNDAAGQAIEWVYEKRKPKLIEEKCLSCMICSFICPVPGLITFKEMPRGWKRKETAVMDRGLE